jgi:hypothetical protein
MKFIVFAAAALLAASPALATPHQRAAAGGDPDLDLTVRPRDSNAPVYQPGRDDNVYLPGLTEPAGARTAADMAQYKGMGGPVEEDGYPPCSATVKDRCIELDNPAG